MNESNPILDVLRAQLSVDWTIEALAERVLDAVAAGEFKVEHRVDAAGGDLQSRRLIRPLLACLAVKSAAESGSPVSQYGGPLSFHRGSADGRVRIVGEFENQPGRTWLRLAREVGVRDAMSAIEANGVSKLLPATTA